MQNDFIEKVKSGDVVRLKNLFNIYMIDEKVDLDVPVLEVIRPASSESSCMISVLVGGYRDWETDRKSTRLNSSH